MPDRSIVNSPTHIGDFVEKSSNTPNFRKLKESGGFLPDNSYFWYRRDYYSDYAKTYNGYRTELQSAGLESLYSRMNDGYWVMQSGGARFGHGHSATDIHQVLRNQLSQRLRDAPIDLGVALGEYRETASLVAGSMVKAAQLYRDVRKHPFAVAKRVVSGLTKSPTAAAKAAANAWLGYSYAVRPLMQDCWGAVQALTKGIGADVPVHVVKASFKEDLSGSAKNGARTMHVQVQGQVRGTGRMICYVENPFTYTLDQLGVVNPVSLAWELIPFSFVVDWFVPVGDMLRSIVPPAGVKLAKGYTYVKADAKWYRRTDINSPPASRPGWHTVGRGRMVYKERKHLTELPRFEYVRPDLSLSYSQLASAAAMLTRLL